MMLTGRRSRRRTSILVLSATMAVSAMGLGIVGRSGAIAQTAEPAAAMQQPAMGNKDRLARGIDEYKKGQYEEALADLQQVSGDELAGRDKADLATYLQQAENAASQRKAARAEFEQGEEALKANNFAQASAHYRAAIDNRFADDGTKAKAREQMAVVSSMQRQSADELKSMYGQAVADFRANKLSDAREKFQQLQAAGYRAGFLQRSVDDYLKDIDRRMPAPAEPAVAQNNQQNNQTPPAMNTAQTPPPPAPVEGAATPPTAVASQSPDLTPTPQPAPAVETPAPEIPAENLSARQAYVRGRDLYNKGDWINARTYLEMARDKNYRPGLFEQSPSRYIARMDAKEQADAQLAMQTTNAAPAAPAAPGTENAGAATPEQRQAEARELVTQAEAARAEGRYDAALALFNRAAELDPNNNAAIAGQQNLSAILNRSGTGTDPLAVRARENAVQRDFIHYSLDTALTRAREAIASQDFDTARTQIELARVAANQNSGIFTDDETRQFQQRIRDTELALSQAQEQQRLNSEAIARTTATEALRTQEERQRIERERTIADLIREARRMVADRQYEQALGVIDQILKLDANNDYALGARPLIEDRAIVAQQRFYRERYERNVVRQYNSADEALIPYSDILKYPDNWPDLSAMRDRTTAAERGDNAADAAVVAQLERKLPEVRFDNVGFSDVLDFLRDVTSANIFVNWRALETAGIDRNAPVTARLRDVKFSKALETILRDVGGGNVRLGYTVDEGVISISTEEDLSSNVVTNVYDVRDLIVNVADFDQPPQFQINQASQAGRGGGGGGQGLFQGNLQQQNNQQTRTDLVDQIITLIQDTVATETWKDNGGTVGSIRELSGQLIVTQTPENQRNLVHLLEQLRETRAIQITVETRFLTVQRNFLEEIGVDFDVVINSGNLWSQVGTVSIQNNTLAYTQLGALSTSVPGNIATELTGTSASTGGVTPNFGIGNGTGGPVTLTFLDDFQVSMLLRATQIAQNTSTMTAPRITLFNGQRAFVVVSTETAYVSDLTPIVGTNAVAFDPTVGIAQSGVLLDVQATVSADRKYVTLTLRPTLTRLRALVPFPVSALTTATGNNGGGATQTVTTAFIQQPVRDVTNINTTVSVPDGGTLLLGGQTLAGEIERESGVPVLSKIPFLKRLFTNMSMAKDEQILLMLVKPTIIIQREQENTQFPLLGSRVGG
jgi:general secretion pathway protein D